MQSAAEYPYPGVRGFIDHCVCSIGYCWQLLLGEGHSAVIERDQVKGHSINSLSGPAPAAIAVETDKATKTHRPRPGKLRRT
jgi:hypothetical protein